MVARSVKDRRGKCVTCGGPRPVTNGRQYCDDCRPRKTDPATTAKRRADKAKADAAPPGQKWCARCDNYLPLAQFGTRASSDKPAAYCIPCQKAYLHESRLKKVFGIDAAEYGRLLQIQGGRCAICRAKPRTRQLAVDHDHHTDEIRGLLCTRCNHKILGAARENVDILRRAAHYLEAPPALVGTVDHLEPSAGFQEAVERLSEAAELAAPGAMQFVIWAPDSPDDLAVGEWLVIRRLEDDTRLLRAAGYGDPEQEASA